jgi:hypothetical protein
MTACQAIKREILLQAIANNEFEISGEITEASVDDLYDECIIDGDLQDYESEFRASSDIESKLSTEYSRHYESKSVAKQLSNGEWVGWTYWYGGGKHGNPEEIEWMKYAYFLEVTEQEKLVVVREFKKKD